MLEFEERTIKVMIDDSKCLDCETKICIDACSLYARGLLKLKDGKPALESPEEVKRLGTECLACEFECRLRGLGAITIEAPMPLLDEYKAGLSK